MRTVPLKVVQQVYACQTRPSESSRVSPVGRAPPNKQEQASPSAPAQQSCPSQPGDVHHSWLHSGRSSRKSENMVWLSQQDSNVSQPDSRVHDGWLAAVYRIRLNVLAKDNVQDCNCPKAVDRVGVDEAHCCSSPRTSAPRRVAEFVQA